MKDKDNQYRNYIDYPDAYNNCCGGATIGADGSEDVIPERDLGDKVKKLVAGVVVLVGIVVTATWVYNKVIKK